MNDRFIIWPLLSLALCFTCVMPPANTIWTCFLTAVMAVMALVGAMVRSDYKWGALARTLASDLRG